MMKMSPIKMRFVAACLTAAVVCCAISCVLTEVITDNATEKVDQKAAVSQDGKPPNALVDFSRFREKFHKSYGSALETARRMKLFLARSMAAFNSVIQYSQKKIGSFKAINEFSDRSDEELRKMFIPLDKLKTEQPKAVESLDMGWMSKLGLKKKKKNKNDASGSGANNPSGGDGDGGGGSDSDNNRGRNSRPASNHDEDSEEEAYEPDTRVVYDLRNSDCLPLVKNQGDCGSCYAFSMTTMYEYYFCLQHDRRERFSEQYIIDCGYITGSGGCEGGAADVTMRFVNEYGLELASNRPYVAALQGCPYADRHDPQRFDRSVAGFFRLVGETHNMHVAEILFPDVLQLGRPVFTLFRFSAEDYASYGGGIMCPQHNNQEIAHSVLIIGFGYEDDVPYYIATNSMGIRWGERGYWRIRRDCVEASRFDGIAFLGDFSNFQFKRNRNWLPIGRYNMY